MSNPAQLLGAGFDFLCTRRVAELVDVERLLAAVETAGATATLARLYARLVVPARARLWDALRASETSLSAWLPDTVRARLAHELARPAPIPPALIERLVHDAGVRASARAMLQEALSAFVNRAFAAAPGGRGLRGVLGLGARAAGGLLGGIGEELQRQLEERVRDFVDSGVQLVQRRAAEKLASPATAAALGEKRREAFLALMRTTEAETARLAADEPTARAAWALIDELAPEVVAHNIARPEVRARVKAQIAAAIEELSRQTIGELLDDLGIRAAAKESFVAGGLPLVVAFLASPEFAAAAG